MNHSGRDIGGAHNIAQSSPACAFYHMQSLGNLDVLLNCLQRMFWKTLLIYLQLLWQIIFLETICNDRDIIERNIRLKIQQSPDYAEEYGYFLELPMSHLL